MRKEDILNFLKSSETEYLLPETKKLIGSKSESAERVRRLRSKKADSLQCNAHVTECNADVTDCNENVMLENRDKSKEMLDVVYRLK